MKSQHPTRWELPESQLPKSQVGISVHSFQSGGSGGMVGMGTEQRSICLAGLDSWHFPWPFCWPLFLCSVLQVRILDRGGSRRDALCQDFIKTFKEHLKTMTCYDETNVKINHPNAVTVPEALDFWRNLPHRGPLAARKSMVIWLDWWNDRTRLMMKHEQTW